MTSFTSCLLILLVFFKEPSFALVDPLIFFLILNFWSYFYYFYLFIWISFPGVFFLPSFLDVVV